MNQFINLLTWLENEVRYLLTAHRKATASVSVQDKAITINLRLRRQSFYVDSNVAVISVKGNQKDSLTNLTFSGMTTQNGRTIIVERVSPTTAEDLMAKYQVFVAYGNDSDREALDGGQSVSLTYNLTLTATAAITNVGITYQEDYL